ncbi:reverse transcriptase domain-containing protein [Tanacetum coccineum]
MAPRGRPTRLNPDATPTPVTPAPNAPTATTVTEAQLQALINQGNVPRREGGKDPFYAEPGIKEKKEDDHPQNNSKTKQQQNREQNTGQAYCWQAIVIESHTIGRKASMFHVVIAIMKRNNKAPAKVIRLGNAGATQTTVVAVSKSILTCCYVNFLNHPFNINLMPVEMGSFDVIIGMDWLSKYNAVIDCAKKIVRIPVAANFVADASEQEGTEPLRFSGLIDERIA